MIIAKEIIKLFRKRLGEVRKATSPEGMVRPTAKLDHDTTTDDIEKEEINQDASRTKEK